MIKAVIFDFDDTLVRTSESKYQALKVMGQTSYGLTLTDAAIRAVWGLPFPAFLTQLFGSVDTFTNLKRRYDDMRPQFPTMPYEDALPTLYQLLQNYPVGILSSAAKSWLWDDLGRLQFPTDRFIWIQAAEDTPVHKPHPGVFSPLLTRLQQQQINPAEVIYVGDSLNDYYAARDAGLVFYGMANRTTPAEQFIAAGVACLYHLSELPARLGATSRKLHPE